ncbi:Imm10 family immunity protein [Streptomyces sp. NPDC002285]
MSHPLWIVKFVGIHEMEPDSTFLVGLAEDEYGDGSNIVFQCGLKDPDNQQRQHGVDTCCILGESGGVQYGGLNSVKLSGRRIEFHFNSDAARELSLPGQEMILGIAPEVDVTALRNGLRTALTWGDPQKIPGVLDL